MQAQQSEPCPGQGGMVFAIAHLACGIFGAEQMRQRIVSVITDQPVREPVWFAFIGVVPHRVIKPNGLANVELRVPDQCLVHIAEQQILEFRVREVCGTS